MTKQEILNILPCILPLYTALVCWLLLRKLSRSGESQLSRRSIRTALWAYGWAVWGWLSIILYIALPQLYVIFNAPIMWVFAGVSVLYYRFFFELTKTSEDERFPMVHFLLPTLIATVLLVWSFFVPFDVQIQLVESRGKWVADYPYYSALFTSTTPLFSIFYAVYTILGLRRAIRFRKTVVNYSADEERSSLRWLYQILFVMLGSFPLAVALVLFSKQQLTSFPIIIIPAVAFMLKDVMILHNVLLDNFVVISHDSQPQGDKPEPITRDDVRRLETYMRKQKPYLDPHLKITEIADALSTNRSSLSLLINRTYGMNFCRFVNRFRMDELKRLKADSANASLSELDLVAKAGFSDWRGYVRVRQREDVNI